MTLPKDPTKIEEYRRKISKAHSEILKKQWEDPEYRERMCQMVRGKNNPHYGIPHSPETRKKLSEAQRKRWAKPEEHLKASECQKGHPTTPEANAKRSATLKGRVFTPEHRAKLAGHTGPKSSQWKGGVSFEPYCPKFTNEFKERVREFWGRKCFVCGITEADLGYRLHVHHVNYDKNVCCNGRKPLFIPLCNGCHGKTTHGDREGMSAYLTEQILLATDGECYLPKAVV